MKIQIIVLTIILIAISVFAENPISSETDLEEALHNAENNRSKLETVLEHYSRTGDSLKFMAARYLITNMEGHCFAKYKLIDSNGNRIEFNVLDYPDFDSMVIAVENMETQYGTLDFKRDTLIYDYDAITSDFLITQIDLAFKAWREKPWSQKYSFEIFCNYILPYRGSNEPLEPWREYFLEKYDDLNESMIDPSDPVEAAALINNDVMSWFKFDERYYFHPTDESLSEMLETKMGRCEDMTNLAIYAMRANAIPVTSDYTPHWASTGNNHAWNAIISADGKAIPFMGAESNPGQYGLPYKLAKVYRKTFGQQKDNLVFIDRRQEKIAPWMAGKSFKDVTTEYIPTANVVIKHSEPIPDSIDIAYVCVFNSGNWKAIDWAIVDNAKSAGFTKLGMDIVYISALYKNEEIFPISPPFILNKDSSIKYLIPDTVNTTALTLNATTDKIFAHSTEGVKTVALKDDQTYELFYWDKKWQSLGTRKPETGSVLFENVPSHALYWLVAEDSDKKERIFTYENGQQIWW